MRLYLSLSGGMPADKRTTVAAGAGERSAVAVPPALPPRPLNRRRHSGGVRDDVPSNRDASRDHDDHRHENR